MDTLQGTLLSNVCYAVYTDANDNVQKILLSCGVQEEDEDSDSTGFTAESIGDYIFDELQLLSYVFNAIEFISGDNTSVNYDWPD